MSKHTLCPGVLPGLISIWSPELPRLAAEELKSTDSPSCVPWTWQGWCFHGPARPVNDNGAHPVDCMKSPLPWRGCLPGKEIIHALPQLCLKLVEEQDPVSFSDKSWDFAMSALFRRVYAGITKLKGVVWWDERLKASVIATKCPNLTKKCHCILLGYS